MNYYKKYALAFFLCCMFHTLLTAKTKKLKTQTKVSRKVVAKATNIQNQASDRLNEKLSKQAAEKALKNNGSQGIIKTDAYADMQNNQIQRPKCSLEHTNAVEIYYPRQYYSSPAEYRSWSDIGEVQRVKYTSGPR